jgi:TonB family protein
MITHSPIKWRPAFALIVVLNASYSVIAAADDSWSELRCRGKGNDKYYPREALSRHDSGAVLVEYSVNAKGVTERIVVLESGASNSFQAAALRLIGQVHCKPKKEWIDGGGPQLRFRVNVLFEIIDETPAKPIDPEVGIIKVSSRPPRLPNKLW